MSRRIVAKTGEYQKNGETKGEYTTIGVILNNENGEFVLLDPNICMAGVLAKQNVLKYNAGQPLKDKVMAGIYEDQPQTNSPSQQQQQNQRQGNQQQAPQQNHQNQQNQQNQQSSPSFNDVPF